jgi:cytochrome P450/NADPH-cytochrome P450 reductase
MTEPIPQPKRDPFIGNIRALDGHAPLQSLLRLARIHGPIFRIDFFDEPIILVSSHELVDEVCDESRFDKRIYDDLMHIRDFAGDGLFTASTDEPNWPLAHRLLMPAFGPLGIRGMFGQMLDIADQMLVRWERYGPNVPVDVADNMTRLTLDTIALCAFDVRFNSFYRTEMHGFVGAMVCALEEASARSRRPQVVTRLMLRTQRAYNEAVRLMHEVADSVIAERRSDSAAGQKQDLLAALLKGRDPVTGLGLSDENIRFQFVTFLIAGHETTSGLLSFALHFLLKHPRVLMKARDEVDAVLGKETPRVEHLGRLRYVEQVLLESLRIWPTAPAFALRPLQDTLLGGRYAVTKKDSIFALLPMLHRDPKIWGDDAEDFRPERMDARAMEQLPNNAWKPFGNGQRACIGRAFAMQEAQLVLAMVLQRFDLFEDDPAYQLSITETLTLKPNGLRMRVKRRGDLPFRLYSTASATPPSTLVNQPVPAARGDETPLLVLYGSNTGSAEAFAKRIVADAPAQGYAAQLATLDEYSGRLPTCGPTLILTASYEGQPPDNARQFASWLDTLAPGDMNGVSFGVFGCGNRQWARTYQAVPTRIDKALEAAGGVRLRQRGEADASGDFFGAFEDWYSGLWSHLARVLGKDLQDAPTGGQLRVDIVKEGRSTILRQGDLLLGSVVGNRELVDMSSPLARSKRHIEIALPAGMSYRTGDYLTVLPRNHPDNVLRALRRFNFAADSRVVIQNADSGLTSLPVDHPVAVGDLLLHYVELGQPATRAQIAKLAASTRCPPEKAELQELSDEAVYVERVLGQRASLLDLLERFASCELGFSVFLEMLPPLRARQYSISSSPLWNDARCTLTVAVVDSPALTGQGRYRGLASSYLAQCEPGSHIALAVRPSSPHFHPPTSPETPMIMVCAGTGVAPFRGFLQERAVQAAKGQRVGPSLLFCGCDHPDVDFLYRDELASWEVAGVVSVRPAFFRTPQGDTMFVQHRLWNDRADVVRLFQDGAHVYVCGDGKHMAPAVRETFVRIYQEATGAAVADAERWIEKTERETGRYAADVFA